MDKREAKFLTSHHKAHGKQWRALLVELRKLLDFLVKEGAEVSVGRALHELEFAAQDYIASKKSIIDLYDGKLVHFTVAKERDGLRKIHKSLENALNVAESLPLNASCERLSNDLEPLVLRAKMALDKANRRPNKKTDHDRKLLAWCVACVFRDVLDIKPARTRDDPALPLMDSKRAGYAKVLRKVFGMAGINGAPTMDLGRDIEAGLKLLNADEASYKIRRKEANELTR